MVKEKSTWTSNYTSKGYERESKTVDGVVEVGSIIHLGLKNFDATNIDSVNLTLVVVEVVKGMGKSTPKCRIICGEEQLKILYARRYINPVLNATPNLMGLQEVYKSWQGLPNIIERKAARSPFIVVG